MENAINKKQGKYLMRLDRVLEPIKLKNTKSDSGTNQRNAVLRSYPSTSGSLFVFLAGGYDE